MEKSDFVIIGGVAAGPKAAAVLARRLPGSKIAVFEKGNFISYGICGLPYFASGDISSFEELTKTSYGVSRSADFFKNSRDVDVLTGHEVMSINRDSKSLMVKNSRSGETFEHGYKKLIIATGARPVDPPFPIAGNPRIRPFVRPDDAIHFRRLAQQGKISRAIIIGGGFSGCELAEAMGSLWGIETTLIEKENQLIPYALDREMADIVKRELLKQGINLYLNHSAKQVSVDSNENLIVKIDDKDNLAADYVFLCLGVKPEVSLAKSCGLKTGKTGGILVNKRLQTSDPDIYAGGNCIESYHQLTGEPIHLPMGSLANRHGRLIAENLSGTESEFPGVLGSFLVKVFDLNVGSVGLTRQAAEAAGIKASEVWGTFADKPDYYPESKTFTLKMVYRTDNDQLLGLQAAGGGEICRRIDVFSAFLQRQGTFHDLLDFEHGYAPPYSDALDPLHHLAAIAIAGKKGIEFISPGAEFEKLDRDIIWLHVREDEETSIETWTSIGNNQLVNIPLNDLNSRLNELDRHKKIMVICKRGSRSYQAYTILKQAGFQNISIVGGGTAAAI